MHNATKEHDSTGGLKSTTQAIPVTPLTPNVAAQSFGIFLWGEPCKQCQTNTKNFELVFMGGARELVPIEDDDIPDEIQDLDDKAFDDWCETMASRHWTEPEDWGRDNVYMFITRIEWADKLIVQALTESGIHIGLTPYEESACYQSLCHVCKAPVAIECEALKGVGKEEKELRIYKVADGEVSASAVASYGGLV